jgi:hypothetical protein
MGKDVLQMFDYCFFENGLVAYKRGELIHRVRRIEARSMIENSFISYFSLTRQALQTSWEMIN